MRIKNFFFFLMFFEQYSHIFLFLPRFRLGLESKVEEGGEVAKSEEVANDGAGGGGRR